MFSILLSSEEDFPIPIDTSKPECGAVPHPPMIETAPTLQAQYPLPHASQPSLPPPRPPPPPPPTTLTPSASVPNTTSIPAALSGLSSPATFATSSQPDHLKRPCDDDVQFVSEKAVKRRRLESPVLPSPVITQQQRTVPLQAGPLLSHAAAQPVQGEAQSPVPPTPNHTHVSTADPERELKQGGIEAARRRASLSSLEHYVFPTSFPSGPSAYHEESPPLSPKQMPDTVTPGPLQRPSSQPVTSSEGSRGLPQDPTGNGQLDEGVIRKDPENETGTSPAPSSQNVPLNGDAEPAKTDAKVSVTQQLVGEETAPQVTVSPRNPAVSASEASHENGPAAKANKPFESRYRSKSQEALRQQRQGPTTPSTTVLPGGQSNSWPPSPTSAPPQDQTISSASFGPQAYHSGQQNSTTDSQQSRPVQGLPCNETTGGGGPRFPQAAPKTSTTQPMGVTNLARPQAVHRSPAQLQAQTNSPFPAQPQPQMHSQGNAQNQHLMGHPSGPGLSKAHCKICAARRQQMARQKAAASGGGGMAAFPNGALPSGTMSQHLHVPGPNGAGYNADFVPTPMQGANGLAGAQFTSLNQSNTNSGGVMGRPSHPYMLQNPQQGPAVVSSVAPQARRMVNMTNQTTSPQQVLPPRRFPHHEPSAGKHIIVDIADTAMEVFPFSRIAKRHNVGVDKVRNIFEAVVAVPFLRVPADKRRAGKIGQERVKEYLAAKKEAEREGVVSAYEVARVMGPEAPGEWAQGFSGPW